MCVDQSRDALDDNKTVFDELCGGADELVIGGRAVPSRAYATWYNFRGGDQQKRVGDLSGGERNRLQLAKTLLTGGNLLLLDEPTNECAPCFERVRVRARPALTLPRPCAAWTWTRFAASSRHARRAKVLLLLCTAAAD